jgi:hypothetical protein
LIHEHHLEFAEAARLLNRAGFYLGQRARYTEAEPLLQRALGILEKALGPDHPHTRMCRDNLDELRRRMRGGQEPPT